MQSAYLEAVCQSGGLVVHPALEPVVEDGLVHGGELVTHGGAPEVLRGQDEEVAHGVEGVEELRDHGELPVRHAASVLLHVADQGHRPGTRELEAHQVLVYRPDHRDEYLAV